MQTLDLHEILRIISGADLNEDGNYSIEELHEAFGPEMSESQLQKLFSKIDSNNDGEAN